MKIGKYEVTRTGQTLVLACSPPTALRNLTIIFVVVALATAAGGRNPGVFQLGWSALGLLGLFLPILWGLRISMRGLLAYVRRSLTIGPLEAKGYRAGEGLGLTIDGTPYDVARVRELALLTGAPDERVKKDGSRNTNLFLVLDDRAFVIESSTDGGVVRALAHELRESLRTNLREAPEPTAPDPTSKLAIVLVILAHMMLFGGACYLPFGLAHGEAPTTSHAALGITILLVATPIVVALYAAIFRGSARHAARARFGHGGPAS